MRYAVAFAACISIACGGSSSSTPSPTPARIDLNGQWKGTFSIIAGVTPVSEAILSGSVTQSGTSVNGTWSNTADRTGTFTGTLASEFVTDGRMTGTMRISVPSGTGLLCTASGPFTGTVTPTFVITAPAFVWDTCLTNTASNGVLSLTR